MIHEGCETESSFLNQVSIYSFLCSLCFSKQEHSIDQSRSHRLTRLINYVEAQRFTYTELLEAVDASGEKLCKVGWQASSHYEQETSSRSLVLSISM